MAGRETRIPKGLVPHRRSGIHRGFSYIAHKRRNTRFNGLWRVHTPPHPPNAHTAAHTPKHGGLSGSMVTMFSVVRSSTPSALFRQIRRSPLLLRKDTVMPLLLRASTLLRIRWEKLLGGQSLRTGRVDLFQQHLGRGADLRLPAQQFREKKKNPFTGLLRLFAVI